MANIWLNFGEDEVWVTVSVIPESLAEDPEALLKGDVLGQKLAALQQHEPGPRLTGGASRSRTCRRRSFRPAASRRTG